MPYAPLAAISLSPLSSAARSDRPSTLVWRSAVAPTMVLKIGSFDRQFNQLLRNIVRSGRWRPCGTKRIARRILGAGPPSRIEASTSASVYQRPCGASSGVTAIVYGLGLRHRFGRSSDPVAPCGSAPADCPVRIDEDQAVQLDARSWDRTAWPRRLSLAICPTRRLDLRRDDLRTDARALQAASGAPEGKRSWRTST